MSRKARRSETQLTLWPEEPAKLSRPSRELRPNKVNTIKEIRRYNLEYLINSRFQGVKNRLAKHAGVTHMQIARIFHQGTARRDLGDKLSRKIERACDLEEGWLDQDRANALSLVTRINLLDVQSRAAIEALIQALLTNRSSGSLRG